MKTIIIQRRMSPWLKPLLFVMLFWGLTFFPCMTAKASVHAMNFPYDAIVKCTFKGYSGSGKPIYHVHVNEQYFADANYHMIDGGHTGLEICDAYGNPTNTFAAWAGEYTTNKYAFDEEVTLTNVAAPPAVFYVRFQTWMTMIVEDCNFSGADICTGGDVKCKICGYTKHINGAGHSASPKQVTAATCTSPAVYHDTCDRCGVETRGNYHSGNALGHSWGSAFESGRTAATCTANGTIYYKHTCTRCHTSEDCGTAPIAAGGHHWDAGSVTKPPTVYATGVRCFTCTTCQHCINRDEPQLVFRIHVGEKQVKKIAVGTQLIYDARTGTVDHRKGTGTAPPPGAFDNS